jgi:hypothetical protein
MRHHLLELSVKLLLRERGFETIDPLHSVGMSFFDVFHMIAHEMCKVTV